MKNNLLLSLEKILLYIVSLMILGSLAQATENPVLKERIVVFGDIVKLGDLFENAGDLKNIAVFRSPDLGEDGVISAARVQEAAKQHGLEWDNPGGVDKLLVRRPSRVLALAEIKKMLAAEMADKAGIVRTEDLTVTFAIGTKDIHIDSRNTAPVIVMNAAYNPQTRGFRALIGTEEATGNIPRAQLRGRIDQTAMVIVPQVPLEPGKEIEASDLKSIRISADRLRTGAIRDEKKVVGMAAKYRLAPNQFIREKDLEVPKIINTNELVNIKYEIPGLSISAEGRALGGGARGDVISVLNTRSKLKIQAEIIGPGEVKPAVNTTSIITQTVPKRSIDNHDGRKEKRKKAIR